MTQCQWANIDSGNGMALNKQSITWANDNLFDICIYVKQGP